MEKISNHSWSCPSGYEDDSRAEYKHDYNRKSCDVPVAIDSDDHNTFSPIMFKGIATFKCHSGHSLDGTPDENKISTTTCGVAANGSIVVSSTPFSCALTSCKKVTCRIPLLASFSIASVRSQVCFLDVVKYSCEEGHTVTGLADGNGAFVRRYNCSLDLQPDGWVRGWVLEVRVLHCASGNRC